MRIRLGQKQQGVSLGGLLVVMFIVVIVGIMSLKLIPGYIEYAKAKAAIEAIAADRTRNTSVAEVRKAFDARATIDDITVPNAKDLEITKEGGNVVISFAYRKEFPLFANVGLYVDFAASSTGR
jgi:Tfp pilus assembly protein PilE